MSEAIHNIGNISENGFINHGNKLYSIFYDGIYQLIPNNLAESDTTPTENLKITDAIQDIYDTIHDKTDIISIYDQYRDEILFRWHRNPKNMVKNSDFASGASYWEMDAESGGIIADTEKYSGSFSSSVDVDGDMGASPGNGFISDFIPVDPTKTYSVSAYAKCPDLTNGNFYVGYLYYDESKNRIGDYPRIKKFSSSSDSWQRYSKVITSFPTGAKYVRLRSYWWTSSNIDMPQGIGYCDQWQFEQGDTTAWESYESSQEIWAFSIVTGKWRQIHTTGSVCHFTLDSDASVIYWDDRDHKIKSFNEKESVSASIKTLPITLTDDRYEVVRRLSTKVKSSDELTVNIIADGNTVSQTSATLNTQTRPTIEKNRLRKKCKDVQLEIIAPASTNDVEVHKIELEYT